MRGSCVHGPFAARWAPVPCRRPRRLHHSGRRNFLRTIFITGERRRISGRETASIAANLSGNTFSQERDPT